MTSHLSCTTLPSLTFRALARHPDRTAFRSRGDHLTCRGALRLIGAIQYVFAAEAIGRGHRIMILSANRYESWCAGIAAQGLAAAVSWLHPRGSLDDHVGQVLAIEPTTLVVDERTFGERGAELARRFPELRIFSIGRSEFARGPIAAAEKHGEVRPTDVSSADDVATISFTGGTTGKSKGVVRTSRIVTQMISAVLTEFEVPESPRYLAVAPISHVTGTNIVPTLLRGGCVHLMDKFDPDEMLDILERERINFTLAVPTIIYAMLDHPRLEAHDLRSLETFLYGGSAMSPRRLEEAITRIGPVFSQLYGQAECYPIAVLRRIDHDLDAPGIFEACGFPTTLTEVTLRTDEGSDAIPGESGEICVRSPIAMREYWRDPQQTGTALEGGWLHTGDIARRDDRGCLYIVDRKKDMIVSGGFNVYPREIEDVLSSHSSVRMSAVIGVPDSRWGEAVRAFVVLRKGVAPCAEELVELVKTKKGGMSAPKVVEFVDDLPMTSVGKIDKRSLREPFWINETRRVG